MLMTVLVLGAAACAGDGGDKAVLVGPVPEPIQQPAPSPATRSGPSDVEPKMLLVGLALEDDEFGAAGPVATPSRSMDEGSCRLSGFVGNSGNAVGARTRSVHQTYMTVAHIAVRRAWLSQIRSVKCVARRIRDSNPCYRRERAAS